MDFAIELKDEQEIPLYKQISDYLQECILSGRLPKGEALPSSRRLAEMLGVSRVTVIRSYEELLSKGFVTTSTGAGTYVSYQRCQSQAAVSETKTNGDVSNLSPYAKRLLELPALHSTSADLAELNFGAPPPDLLPLKQWRQALLEQSRTFANKDFEYKMEAFGYRPLREAIAGYLSRSRAVICSADQIAVFSAAQQPLNLIGRLLVAEGDQVAVENPGFVAARTTFLAQNASLFPVTVDNDGLVVGELVKAAARCKLVYVTPSHHDPTGVVMSMARRTELLAWVDKHGVYAVEDDFDCEYRYGSRPMPSLQGLDKKNRVFYIGNFWKILYPILPIGFLVIPPQLLDLFERAITLSERSTPLLEQHALANFIEEGFLERYIMKTRNLYSSRRQALISSLTTSFKKEVFIAKESAGMHQLVRFDLPLSERSILEAALEADFPLVSTAPYYLGNPAEKEFLVPFAPHTESDINAAVQRFANELTTLRE